MSGIEQYAVVELTGERKIAGFVSEAMVCGAGFVRIETREESIQFYPISSVKSLTLLANEDEIESLFPAKETHREPYQFTNIELIELLTLLTTTTGKHRFSANQICNLIGGDRGKVLEKVRTIREEVAA